MSASTPRILQSADEAPCGSLIHRTDVYGTKVHTLRLWNGNGWNLDCGGRLRGTEGWPWGSRANGPCTLIAEGLTEAECRHLSGLSAADAIAWCEHRAVRIVAESMTPADVAETIAWAGEQSTAKPRPQPGDVVPWDEVEDGALYWRKWSEMYCMAMGGEQTMVTGPDDEDILRALNSSASQTASPDRTVGDVGATLVARDLGTDPEAWRKAMREWTANGNKPTSKAAPKAAEDVLPLRDEFTRSIDLTGAWMCLMTGPLGNNGARWSLETTIGNTNNLRMRWPSGCTTTLKDPR